MIKKILTALALAIPALTHATVVEIVATRAGEETFSGQATAVANGVLLTRSILLNRSDTVLVIEPTSGLRVQASVISKNEEHGLTLLSLDGIDFSYFTPSIRDLVSGEQVTMATIDGERSGLVLSVANQQFTHDIEFVESEYGTMILNRCGELAGYSNDVSGGFLGPQFVATEAPVNATMISEYSDWLVENGVAVAKERCLTFEEAATIELNRREQDIADAQEVLEAQEEQLRETQEQLEEALETTQTTEAEAAEIQARLEEQATELNDQIAESQAQLEELLANIEEATTAADEAREQAEIAEEQANSEAEERERVTVLSGITVAIILLVLLLVVIALRRRKQQLADAKARFNDVLFTGHDGGGNPYRVRVDGIAIMQSEDGMIIGKNSREANLVISNAQVSRRHARIWVVDGELKITDLGSSNGTTVNGVPVSPGSEVSIRHGDHVHFGGVHTEVEFVIS